MNENFLFLNENIEDLISENEIIFIATNHSIYKDLTVEDFKGKLVIDPWRVLGRDFVIDQIP